MSASPRVLDHWVSAVTAIAELSPAQAEVVLGCDVMARLVDSVLDLHDRPYSGRDLAAAADELMRSAHLT